MYTFRLESELYIYLFLFMVKDVGFIIFIAIKPHIIKQNIINLSNLLGYKTSFMEQGSPEVGTDSALAATINILTVESWGNFLFTGNFRNSS